MDAPAVIKSIQQLKLSQYDENPEHFLMFDHSICNKLSQFGIHYLLTDREAPCDPAVAACLSNYLQDCVAPNSRMKLRFMVLPRMKDIVDTKKITIGLTSKSGEIMYTQEHFLAAKKEEKKPSSSISSVLTDSDDPVPSVRKYLSRFLHVAHPFDVYKVYRDEFDKQSPGHIADLWSRLNSMKMTGSYADFLALLEVTAMNLTRLKVDVHPSFKLNTLLNGLPKFAEEIHANIRFAGDDYEVAKEKLKVYFDRVSYRMEKEDGPSSFPAITDRNGCSKCGPNAHHSDKRCFIQHPELKGQRPASGSKGKGGGECHYCHQKGHFIAACPKRQKAGGGSSQPPSSSKPQKGSGQHRPHPQLSGGGSIPGPLAPLPPPLAMFNQPSANVAEVSFDEGFIAGVSSLEERSNIKLADSGSQVHLLNNINDFTNIGSLQVPVNVRGVGNVKIHAAGKAILHMVVGERNKKVVTMAVDAYYAPFLRYSLISVGILAEVGFSMVISPKERKMSAYKNGVLCMVADNVESIFRIRTLGMDDVVPPAPVSIPVYPAVVSGDGSGCPVLSPASAANQSPGQTVSDTAITDAPGSGESRTHFVSPSASVTQEISPSVSPTPIPIDVAHQRLAHLSQSGLSKLVAEGLCVEGELKVQPCAACAMGKSTRAPFSQRDPYRRATRPLYRVHADLMGPFPVVSVGGFRYVLTLTDEATGHKYVFPLKSKDQTFYHFKDYHRYWTARLNKLTGEEFPLLFFHPDGGGEFIGREWNVYFHDHGIHRESSLPYTPQQNGTAERSNRTLINKAIPLLLHAGVPRRFWDEAFKLAATVANMSPFAPNQGATPGSLWPDKPWYDIHSLLTFGCEVFAHTPHQKRNKLDARARRCVYMGPDHDHKAHRLYDMESAKFVSARPEDCKANENVFPFRHDKSEGEQSFSFKEGDDGQLFIVLESDGIPSVSPPVPVPGPPDSLRSQPIQEASSGDVFHSPVSAPPASPPVSPPPLEPCTPLPSSRPVSALSRASSEGESVRVGSEQSVRRRVHFEDESPSDSSFSPSVPLQDGDLPPPLREKRSTAGKPPVFFSPGDGEIWSHPSMVDAEPDIVMAALAEFPVLPPDLAAFAANLGPEPRSMKEAIASKEGPQWLEAINKEMKALESKGTYSLEFLPPGRIAIPVKWVLKRKLAPDGSIARYKARLVAKGFMEKEGVDFDETFSPVAQYRTLKILLAIAAQYDLDLHHLDVVSAFLNGKLDHEIYMKQPEGFDDGSGRVCRLHKAIYGLKQASRCWNAELHSTLIGMGFYQCKCDPCLYVLRNGDQLVILMLYVDDMMLTDNDKALRLSVQARLEQEYELNDMGELRWFLGMEVTRDLSTHTIRLDQSLYASGILAKFKMDQSHPVSTPCLDSVRLTTAQCAVTEEQKEAMANVPYKSAVGSLLHAVNGAFPDLSFAVNVAARFMANPGPEHWQWIKRILRYIRRNPNPCIEFRANMGPPVFGFSDSDWAGDLEDRHSTTGYVFFMAMAPISWATKRQPTVALSSMEAEYMAAAAATQEALSLRSLLHELGYPLLSIQLAMDNRSAIFFTENAVANARTKHIDIRFHFIRECVQQGMVVPLWVSTNENVADLFTKALKPAVFERHRSVLLKKSK